MSLANFKRLILLIAILLLGAALWKYTPLAKYVTPEYLQHISRYLASTKAPVLTMTAAFVAASLILFPVTVMVLITSLTLPPLQSIIAGILGVALSSCTGYLIGWLLGPERVEIFLGPHYTKVKARVQRNVFWSVVILRHLPLGPFTMVNIILGSMHLNIIRFVLANAFSLLPGIAAATFVGSSIRSLLLS